MSSISVVIPVFNCERYLTAAVESILAQSLLPEEILIVDDGSTDGTQEIAQALRGPIRYVRREHEGGAQALNHGIEQASGELLAFLDADDLWMPEKLSLQLAALTTNPSSELVYGHVQQFLSPDISEERKAKLVCPAEPQPGRLISALLARRETFKRIGPLATDLRTGWFIDWSMRAADMGIKHLMLPEVVLRRRIHGDNLSLRDLAGRNDYLEVVKRSLQRRRQGTPS